MALLIKSDGRSLTDGKRIFLPTADGFENRLITAIGVLEDLATYHAALVNGEDEEEEARQKAITDAIWNLREAYDF